MQDENRERKKERQILVFKVADDELGLDISCVREVLRPQAIYPLPETPDFIEGVIRLRGHIVPLLDLGKRLFGRPIQEPGKKIIICRVKKLTVGLTVDALREIVTLSEEDIQPTPEAAAAQMKINVTSSLARTEERIIPVLDLAQIITQKETLQRPGIEE